MGKTRESTVDSILDSRFSTLDSSTAHNHKLLFQRK